VAAFAKKHGITRDRAEMLINKFGNDRAKLDSEAEKLKK
jgi:DNA polymerase III delta subunit